jgi:Fe-S cluster assembly protein SufD
MTEIVQKSKLEDIFISDYHNNRDLICKDSNSFICALRDKAILDFEKKGLPDSKDELYRFTPVRKKMESLGRLLHQYRQVQLDQPVEDIFRCDITELDTYNIAIVNGWYPRSYPLMQTLAEGVRAGSLAEAFELFPELTEKHYNKYLDTAKDPFSALNTAFASDGLFLHFPENSHLEKPFQVVNIVLPNTSMLTKQWVQPRNLIIVEKNARASIVLCDHTLSNDSSFTNIVTEIYVGENAQIELLRLQNQNNEASQLSTVYIHQEKASEASLNTITLNGGFVRNNTNAVLAGPFSQCNLYGLYLIDKKQHVDNHTFIDHAAPDCQSNELFKGILDDQARAVFRGKILVRKNSQHTDSYQKNNNLLLTDEAKIDSLPQLEIYADDVKCSHGATVGYLDDEEMFYLRSRGICKRESRLLLMNAFASEIINKNHVDVLRLRIAFLVNKRLRGELSFCESCVLNCRE